MAKKNFNSLQQEKIALGKAISKLRIGRGYSLRKLAKAVELSPSNLTYIENGVNAPTAEVYSLLLQELKPSTVQQSELDRIYSFIRQVPPPDVCKVLLNNKGLGERIKLLDKVTLTEEQLKKIGILFASFNIKT